MTENLTAPPEKSDSSGSQQPGYLYHKEAPQRRSRVAADRKSTSSAGPTKTHNMAHHVFVANMRTLAVLIVVMALLVALTGYVAKRNWETKERRFEQERRELARSRAASDSESTDLFPSALGLSDTTVSTRPEIDTESIRRALYLFERGKSAEGTGEEDKAIENYHDALDIWPELTEVWSQLGRLYLKRRDFGKAQIALERAVEGNPGSPALLNDLGVSYLYQNRPRDARRFFEAAVDIDVNFAVTYFNLGLCAMAEGNKPEAGRLIQDYLKLNPTDPKALRELAFMQAEAGNYPGALESLRKALVEAPDWPPLYVDAAAATALMGRVEDTIRYLEKAEALTSSPVIYRTFKQPAFRTILESDIGKTFLRDLGDRTREQIQETQEEQKADVTDEVVEPMTSAAR